MARVDIRKIRSISAVELTNGALTIGRSYSNSVVLKDTRVSRKHCVIEMIGGMPCLRDLGSQKGTLVNGRKVNEEPAPLSNGDRITIRPFELVFEHPEAASAQPIDGNDAASSAQVAVLDRQVADLRQQVDSLTAQRDDLKQRLDAAAHSAAEAENQATARRQELERRITDLESSLQSSRSELEQQQRLVEDKDQQIESLAAAGDATRERLAALEARSQKDGTVAATKLEAHRREIESLRDEQATLQRRMGEAESALRSAETHSQRSSDTLLTLDQQLGVVEEAARQLESVDDRLADAEAAWSEIEQNIDVADVDESQAEAVATLRQHLSNQLIELHRERDESVTRLKDLIVALRVVINRHGPVEESPHRLESPTRLRRWLGIGAGRR